PSGLTVVSHLRGVQASITPNTEPDLRHYIWEYRIGTSGSWQVLARDLVTSRVIPAEAGQTVQVRVSAEDWSGNVSPPTQAQSAGAGRTRVEDILAGAFLAFYDHFYPFDPKSHWDRGETVEGVNIDHSLSDHVQFLVVL